MDITQLTTLLYVAELGSLKKASERLNIVQPALSRHIMLLERELGVRLFDRHGRGMQLTEAGTKVLARATRILQEVSSIHADMEAERKDLSGDIVLGLSPNVAELLIVPLARRLSINHPQVKLKVFTAYAGAVLEAMQSGRIDLAVVYAQRKVNSIKTCALLTEPVSVIVSPKLLRPGTTCVSLKDLTALPLIFPSSRHNLRFMIESAASQQGVKLVPRYEADDLNAVRDLVSAGLGVALLPGAGFKREPGRLEILPLCDPEIMHVVELANSISRPLNNVGRATARMIIEEVRTLVGSGAWKANLMGDEAPPAWIM